MKHSVAIDKSSTQHYCCVMALCLKEHKGTPWNILPPGIHQSTLSELATAFAVNHKRRAQFRGLLEALTKLKYAGCKTVYIDGSYVTGKPEPSDFDTCWDPNGVDPHKLDPIFLDFSNNRHNQKLAFMGEFFPSTASADKAGRVFIDFFQIEKYTGSKKGIVEIDLAIEDIKSLTEAWK
jgi:hypothetical protein